MSSTADAGAVMSEGEFRDLLAKMDARLKDIDSTSAKLFDRSNRAVTFLPPGLSDMLHDALVKLRDLMAKFFTEIAKVILNPGWPPGLFSTGSDWTSRVGGPMSSLSTKLSPDQLRVDDFWKGPAADAYAKILPTQQKAVEAIKQATDVIDTNLTKAAWGIIALWLGIIAAVVAYLLELSAEAAAAGTVVGAPPATAAAGASTAKVIGMVVGLIVVFATYVGLLVDSMTSMRQTLHANGPFPDGRWPRSTTSEFDDGSLSDGDSTGWRFGTHD